MFVVNIVNLSIAQYVMIAMDAFYFMFTSLIMKFFWILSFLQSLDLWIKALIYCLNPKLLFDICIRLLEFFYYY